MDYAVPVDLDLADLDDIESPRQIIFAIVEWRSVESMEMHEHDDDDDTNVMELWFPAVLRACRDGGFHGPAATYFGPLHVYDSERKAMLRAAREIKKLKKARAELEKGLEDLTAEAAEEL